MVMAKIDVIISDPLFARLQKISTLLDLEFDEVLELVLVDGGYYRYWVNINKFIEDTSDLIDSPDSTDNIYEIKIDLRQQFHERFEIISDIDSLESKFKEKFRHFKSDIEQHRTFLDFIDILHSEQIIEGEERTEVKEEPSDILSEQDIYSIPSTENSLAPDSEKFVLSVKLLPKKYIPMLVLIAMADFFVIKLAQVFWPSFTFLDILHYNPLQFFPYFLLIIFTSLLTGVLYRHYYNRTKASIPVRREKKELRHFIKKFDSKNPRTYSKDPIIQIHNDIKRLQKLEREFRIKRQNK